MTTNPFTDLQTLLVDVTDGVWRVTLNRPERRNALNAQMLLELEQVFGTIGRARAVVLRGAGGTFCAGADIKDQLASLSGAANAHELIARGNRVFGRVLHAAERLEAPLVAVLEGTVMGGGLGLACVADVVIAASNTKFALPETGLGLIPAQIAPFLARRLGVATTRRLALTGASFDGHEAARLQLVHLLAGEGPAALDDLLADTMRQIRRCAPGANAVTKRLLAAVGTQPLETVLDEAAVAFADALLGDEGQEGAAAFIERRLPRWAQ